MCALFSFKVLEPALCCTKMAACVICKHCIDFDRPELYSKLSEKGCSSINEASRQRGLSCDDLVYSESSPQYTHIKCRSKHTNSKAIKASLKRRPTPTDTQRNLRSQVSPFHYRTCCILCTTNINTDLAKRYPNKKSYQFSHIQSLEFQKTLQKFATERQDEWGQAVLSCLSAINDLPAEEAVYHWDCNIHFRDGRNIPCDRQQDEGTIPCKKPKLGRPKDPSKVDAFEMVLSYLEENDDETITIDKLYNVMIERSGLSADKLYSIRQLKRELQSHYGKKFP